MSRIVKLVEWLQNLPRSGGGPVAGRPAAGGPEGARRARPRKLPIVEPMEARTLLSTGRVALPQAAGNVEILRAQKAPTVLSAVSGDGLQRGAFTLTATLTSSAGPVGGQFVYFQVKGRTVGRATTDSNGVAVLTDAKLKGVPSGIYPRGLTAVFAGDPAHRQTRSRGALIVSRFATALSNVSATGAVGGSFTFTATLTSTGAPLGGQIINFQFNGQSVGNAPTNSQGVATLTNVSLPGLAVGTYPNSVTARFTGGADFRQNTAIGSLTVTATPVTFSLSGLNQTYDGTAKSVTVSTGGLNVPFTVTYTDAGGNVVASPRNAGTYNVAVTTTDPSFSGSASGVLTIAQAQLAVTGITASDKVYNGNAAATINASGASLVGVIPGDNVTLNAAGAIGTFASENVGTNQVVTIGGLTLQGADAANYALFPPTATASITPAVVTVTGIVANSKVYDGTTSTTINISGATLAGVLPSDSVTLSAASASAAFADKNVGTAKTVFVTGLTLSGADAGNYVVAPSTAVANITPATLTATGLVVNNKVYDGTTAATLVTTGAGLSGVVPGDVVTLDTSGASATFADVNVGVGKAVSITGLTLSGAGASNYVLAPPTVTASITAATLTVSGITASNKVYDGTTTTAVDTSGATLAGVVAGDDVTLVTTAATGTFADKNVGVGKVVTVGGLSLAGADALNYTIATVTTTANITAATVTATGITANNKGYDGTTAATLNVAGASLTGVIPGDSVTLNTSNAVGTFDTPDIGNDKTVTITGLSLSGADAGNYVLAQPVTTTADITVGTLTVTGIVASDKVYDGTTAATVDLGSASLSGIAPGDDVALDISGAVATFDTKNVGTSKTITITGLTLTGADAAKYVLGPVTVTANITAAKLSVTGITAADKVYDGTTTASVDADGATLVGVVAGDDVTPVTSAATGTFADKNVGTGKVVTVGGLSLAGADAANYLIDPAATATASITAATLTVTGVTASNKVYDGTTAAVVDAGGAVLSGVVAGDDVAIDPAATGAFADKNVGTAKVVTVGGLTLTGTDASNYVIDPAATATADITAATLTVTGITAADKTFDGTTAATIDTTGAALVGVVSGDDVAPDTSNAVGNFDTPDPGTNKTVFITGVALLGADAENYTLDQPTTTASIFEEV